MPAVEKPGLQDQLQRLLVGKLLLQRREAERDRAVAHQLEVHARAVVGDRDDDFRALALQGHVDDAGLALAGGDARRGQLDAVHDGVAQHVLERREHALEHLAVELARSAVDADFDLLAGLGRRLPRDAGQALDLALERDHARAHEPALQLGDDASLLRQQVLHLARLRGEQALHARDVRGCLRERARVLLDRGVAVELERVEVVAPRAGIDVAMQDLRLGLDLELAQLVLQALHDAAELGEVEVDRRHLLLEARAIDADLAGDVQHVVEEVGVDARHFAALGGGFASRRARRCVRRRRAPRPRAAGSQTGSARSAGAATGSAAGTGAGSAATGAGGAAQSGREPRARPRALGAPALRRARRAGCA